MASPDGSDSTPGSGAIPDPHDPQRQWVVDADFLASNWTCIWSQGCLGILDEPSEHLNQGCCSIGAQLLDEDEARLIGALGATLDPASFQHHVELAEGGAFRESNGNYFTRVVDEGCIFLNRPGFDGGAGCALHLGALADDEPVTDWKPSVCWQAPLKVDNRTDEDGMTTSTVRPWTRPDWGTEGSTMAWLCTETPKDGEPSAFVGDAQVIDSLEHELTELLGPDLYRTVRVHIQGS